jgi:uncharacterized cupredoxin-like copper-binding protein
VYLLIGLVSCYTVFVWLYCWINNKNVSKMTGMTITMIHTMSSSLLVGTLFGIEFTTSFFLATSISILIGLFIGFMSGISFGLVAIADGMLSGVMGGMMGAMAGVMTEPKYSFSLIQLLFLIYFISCFTIFFLNKPNKGSFRTIYFAFLLAVLLSFTSFSFGIQETEGTPVVQEITIISSEFSFTPNLFEVQPDKKVKINVKNNGKLEHRFKLFSNEHKNHPLVITLLPGETETITLTPSHVSEYHFICTLPGHEESGMHGKIKVS